MKDNFSQNSDQYAKFRPSYPVELYNWIYSFVQNFDRAWDCATGNGQVAAELSKKFIHVIATDLSEQQLAQGIKKTNITYQQAVAEHSKLPEDTFDLISVGQALHWFDFPKFFKEVRRVAKPKAIFTAFGYGLNSVNTEIDDITNKFYYDTIGNCWDKERRHIDEQYNSIHFPFEAVRTNNFDQVVKWTVDEYLGYLRTWSAVKHYKKANGNDPVDHIADKLKEVWGNQVIKVTFPIFAKVGSISNYTNL